MQPSTTVPPVSTGFSNLDSLLQSGGIPTGTVCTVRSDPRASGFEFLLSVMQSNLDRARFVTTVRRKSAVRTALGRLEGGHDADSNISAVSDDPTADALREAISDHDIGHRGVIIVDSLDAIAAEDDRTYAELYRELERIATENEAVVVCQYLSGSADSRSVPPVVDYLTDFLLSLSVTTTEEGIKQRLWIERLPVGHALKESQQDTRLVSITDSGEQLSLNTGGRI